VADIEINTVDGFQGREKNVIIFSCVRSGSKIGFLSDYRRMNVALTRGRYALWIVGSANTLSRNSDWNALIQYSNDNGAYQKVTNKSSKIIAN
jgi:superfamily I DNA and/or RNA helicase